jgi:hypothetical protein
VRLSEKLLDLAATMTAEERACLKILLGAAAAELMRSGRLGEGTFETTTLSAIVAAVSRLQPHRDRVPANGVVYRGRPDFVSDELLQALRTEANTLRPTAVRFHDHLVVSGARGARDVAFSPALAALLRTHAGPAVPTTKANYLYYDEPGLGIEPHVDNEEFSLNAIMMLRHEHVSAPSALVLFPLDAPPEKMYLEPGEMVVMFADSIVHARERVGVGEKVSIVAFGFAPVA